MREFLDLHRHVASPSAPELKARNRASGVVGNVPVYSADPSALAERSVWVSLQNWPRLKCYDGSQTVVLASGGMGGDRGDASLTLTPDDAPVQSSRTTLTANRTWTISGDFENGDYFEVVRSAATPGAFTLAVSDGTTTLVTIPASTKARARVGYDGAAWRLTGYGTLP